MQQQTRLTMIFIFTLLLTTLYLGNEADAASVRYTFGVKDANGKAYTVSLVSDQEVKKTEKIGWAFAEYGDTIYSGLYYFTIGGKRQSLANNNQTLEINPKKPYIYTVPSHSKGTPDIIILGQYGSSNIYIAEAYCVSTNGELKKITFNGNKDKKVFGDVALSNKVKNFAPLFFQTIYYSNGEDMGWYFQTYKLDLTNYSMNEGEILFYGVGIPYEGIKKGTWQQGSALVKLYSTDSGFTVTSMQK